MNDVEALWAVCEREAQEFNAAYQKGSRIMVWNLETPRRLVPATLAHGAEVVGKEPSPKVCVRVTFDGPLVDIQHRIDASRVQCLQGSFADVLAAPVVPGAVLTARETITKMTGKPPVDPLSLPLSPLVEEAITRYGSNAEPPKTRWLGWDDIERAQWNAYAAARWH